MSWKCKRCSSVTSELSQCSICQDYVCKKCLDPFVGACLVCVQKLFKGEVKMQHRKAPQRIFFLRDKLTEAALKRYEETAQSWKRPKCCGNPFLKHDKRAGEVFCMKCGEVIVQRTFGQPGRKGADRLGPYARPAKIWSAITHALANVQRLRYEKFREYVVELRNARSSEEIDKILARSYGLFGYRTELLKRIMAIGETLKASLASKKSWYK